MDYTKEQIEFIEKKKPEFRPKPVPSLDAVIVKFLKRYEVDIDSASLKEINVGTALKGGIIGMAKKKTQVEEWTKWKQWALDHKDFEDFRAIGIDEPKAFNLRVLEKLKDPEVQKELEPLMEEFTKKNKASNRKSLVFIALVVAVLGVINIWIYIEDNNKGWNKQNIEQYK